MLREDNAAKRIPFQRRADLLNKNWKRIHIASYGKLWREPEMSLIMLWRGAVYGNNNLHEYGMPLPPGIRRPHCFAELMQSVPRRPFMRLCVSSCKFLCRGLSVHCDVNAKMNVRRRREQGDGLMGDVDGYRIVCVSYYSSRSNQGANWTFVPFFEMAR